MPPPAKAQLTSVSGELQAVVGIWGGELPRPLDRDRPHVVRQFQDPRVGGQLPVRAAESRPARGAVHTFDVVTGQPVLRMRR